MELEFSSGIYSNGESTPNSTQLLSFEPDINATMPPSPLVILRQNSLSIEHIYKNGLQKKVHVVVKNHPFMIQVGLSSSTWEGQKIDFNRYPVEARLLYDTEALKEVNFVKMKPLEFKAQVNERGDQVAVELRPKVLTSQLEDMLFRVRLTAVDSITKQPIPTWTVLSESIKVVSKPEQVLFMLSIVKLNPID
jgi:hypothetical protein